MKQGTYRPSTRGIVKRSSERRISRFGKPVKAKTPVRSAVESSSYQSDSSYERRDDGPGLGTAIIAGFVLGGLLS